jgi:hypothetical protein
MLPSLSKKKERFSEEDRKGGRGVTDAARRRSERIGTDETTRVEEMG